MSKALFLLAFFMILPVGAGAQEKAGSPPSRFEAQVRAADAITLMAGQTPVRLWAVQTFAGANPAFDLRARTTLDNAVGQKKVTCDIKSRDGSAAVAQCVNTQDEDLGLFMIQHGFVSVDRAALYGTVFEDAYIQAEMQAQSRGIGLWAEDERGGKGEQGQDSSAYVMSFGAMLLLCIVGAFTVLSIFIMRGFQRVIEAQNTNVEMMSRERKLRDKERAIVAVMLDSELKANKAKIEAYRVVYEEMLNALKDPDRPPRYKKAGDIIQRQPALARSVFDRNTDKLDMLGGRLSSELVHFYARIKSNPDYVNLEPSTPVEEAVSILEKSLAGAIRLDNLAGKLLEAFANSGIVSEDFQDE